MHVLARPLVTQSNVRSFPLPVVPYYWYVAVSLEASLDMGMAWVRVTVMQTDNTLTIIVSNMDVAGSIPYRE